MARKAAPVVEVLAVCVAEGRGADMYPFSALLYQSTIVGSRAHRISAASHCTSAAFLRPSHFRKLRTTGLQMSSYVIPDA